MRLLLAALVLAACSASAPQRTVEPSTARTPAVATGSPHHDLFEGTSYKNDCAQDPDCHADGCSKEVCSAETGVMTPCLALADQPRDATCGCVAGQCIWYR